MFSKLHPKNPKKVIQKEILTVLIVVLQDFFPSFDWSWLEKTKYYFKAFDVN